MKVGAIIAAAALFGTVFAQDKGELFTTSYVTENGTTVVAFITEDRDDFYELIDRIGKTDKWDYAIAWKPHFRLSVYLAKGTSSDPLNDILKSLKLTHEKEKTSVFNGVVAENKYSKAFAQEGSVSISVKDAASLTVLALASEALGKELRVDRTKSRDLPNLKLEGVSEQVFLRFFGRSARLQVNAEEKRWLVKAVKS